MTLADWSTTTIHVLSCKLVDKYLHYVLSTYLAQMGAHITTHQEVVGSKLRFLFFICYLSSFEYTALQKVDFFK